MFICIDVICEMYVPRVMEQILDVGVQNSDIAYIKEQGLTMLILSIIALVAGLCNILCSSYVAQGYGANLRKGVFKKIQGFSFGNIDQFSSASLITRTTSDINLIQLAVLFSLRLLVRGPLVLISAIVMAFDINPELAIILCIAMPVIMIIIIVLLMKANKLYVETQRRTDQLNSIVQENLQGIRVVKAYVREDHEREKFSKANGGLVQVAYKASVIMATAMPLIILVVYIAEGAAIWLGGKQIMAGVMGSGALISFITYITQVMVALTLIAMALMFVARSRAATARVKEVLNTDIDIADAKGQISKANISTGKVVFDDVTFAYGKAEEEKYKGNSEEEPAAIRNISFEVEPGEILAIVGGTGSGKSTLVNLIPRFYDTSQGSVMIDGQDVRTFALDDLRQGIGMVLQKNILFSGTIRENMRWGNEQATDEEITQACKDAQAHDFIMGFPDQYDTWIEQGGVNVSGGQRQRLCIARAMIKKPKILILDDSTSAVDTITEGFIQEAFRKNLDGTTVIIIAQRISSVCNADLILVLDDGELVDSGTHDELIQRCTIYQEINESQQQGGMAE